MIRVMCLVLVFLSGCASFRSSVIQAPTPDEQAVSRVIYADGWRGTSGADSETRIAEQSARVTLLAAEIAKQGSLEVKTATAVHGLLDREEMFLHPAFRSGDAFCRNIMLFGQESYVSNAAWGAVLGIIGVAGTATSTAWAAQSGDDSSVAVGVSLAASSAVVAAIGAIFVARSAAAATASGDAALAFVPPDEASSSKDQKGESEKWKVCLAARAKWLGSNAEAFKIAEGGGDEAEEEEEGDGDGKN